jgi:hypothetical protein
MYFGCVEFVGKEELGAIAGVCPAMDARRKEEVSRFRER